MKKTIFTVFAFLALFGFAITGAMAQEWTWSYPYTVTVTNPPIVKIVVNPRTGDLYAIDNAGDIVVPDLTQTTTGEPYINGTLPPVIDMAFGAEGIAYGLGKNLVGTCDPASNLCDSILAQPLVPLGSPGVTGVYKSIAVGKDGKLYILYERGTEVLEQFILEGTPPVLPEEAIIKFSPKTLNLSSKGNWVNVQIQLPGDLDEELIIPTDALISEIAVEGFDPKEVAISPAPGAPWVVEINDAGVQVLNLKFIRYNKKGGPGLDEESLTYHLQSILAGANKGKYPVSLTIEGPLTDGKWFQGTATFNANVTKKIK